MNRQQRDELILQSLEHEKGGVQIYQAAIRCAVNEDLKKEWNKYLDETRRHIEVLTKLCGELNLDPDRETPGRGIVRDLGRALVAAMQKALDAGDPAAAQIVAGECVVIAETKDHMDWELLGQCAKKAQGDEAHALKEAYEQVEDEEDEHLYHSRGWCRELWIEALGMNAVLPPPEERRHVKTAIGAARAEQSVAPKR